MIGNEPMLQLILLMNLNDKKIYIYHEFNEFK